jgi:D-alanine transaminase
VPRTAYVNGRFVPMRAAGVAVEDRGLQLADSVYEVILVHAGRLVDEAPHLDRLERSLGEVRMAPAMGRAALRCVMGEVLRRNRIASGMLYVQMTRGTAPRSAAFPPDSETTLIMYARALPPPDPEAVTDGVAVITVPDIRWGRRDIKSTSLLPNVLAKQRAVDEGCFDAWQVDADGFVTEASAANAWIVTPDRHLLTRPVSPDILAGVTRATAIELAREMNVRFVERPFTAQEAKTAVEAFQTNASITVVPVTRIDGVAIGDGKPGPITMTLVRRYFDYMSGGG